MPIPLVIRHVFDHDLRRGGSGAVILGGAAVLALYVGSSGFALASRYAVLRATKSAITDLRVALAAKVFALPKSFHDKIDPRELHATIVQDSERLDVVANAAVGQMLPAAIVSVGLAVVALVLNLQLFAVLVAVVPLLVLVKRRLGGHVRARTRSLADGLRQVQRHDADRLARPNAGRGSRRRRVRDQPARRIPPRR